MAVIATLVLGADGSSTLNGTSDGISTQADRQRFLKQRRMSDCLIIGGNTARNERYTNTPVPVVVLSRSRPELIDQNPQAYWWKFTPLEALSRAKAEFGSKILIEAGISIISELLSQGAIPRLELSVTPFVGGENRVNPLDLLAYFKKIERTEIENTIFYTCTEPITLQK